jgi:hypothetical protein
MTVRAIGESHTFDANEIRVMKKTVITGLLGICIVLAGCKKYPEGPGFSISSAKSRIAQEWAIVLALLNGSDVTLAFNDVFFDIEKDGDYTRKTPFGNTLGTWSFNDDKTQIIFLEAATSQKDTMQIIRLTKKEFKAEHHAGSDTFEYTMNPVE